MPRYYFNVYNDYTVLDDEGIEFAAPDAARAYAVEAARSLAAESVMHGHLTASHRIEIVDERHETVAVIRFGEAVEIRP